MLIQSSYLAEQIDVDVMEVYNEKNPEELKMRVIAHDSLRSVYINKLLPMGVQCEYTPVFMDKNHYAVLCKLYSIDEKREAQEIGEAVPNTLVNQIAKDYPILITYQRAFDRALIAFLGLQGKVLSDVELNMNELTAIPPLAKEGIAEGYERKKQEQHKESENTTMEAEEVYEDGNFLPSEPIISSEIEDDEPVFEDSPEEDKEENTELAMESIEQYENYVIKGGKYQGKTVGQCISELDWWGSWMLKKYSPKGREEEELMTAVRKVCEARGIK